MRTWTTLLILGSFLTTGHAIAQEDSTAPYRRYADAIETTADSVIQAFHSTINGNEPDLKTTLTRLDYSAPLVIRLSGDFDAVQPPADLERLHDQLVSVVTEVAARVDSLRFLLRAGMDETNPSRGLAAGRLGQALLPRLMQSMVDYMRTRDRAARMLGDRGVTLAPLELQ